MHHPFPIPFQSILGLGILGTCRRFFFFSCCACFLSVFLQPMRTVHRIYVFSVVSHQLLHPLSLSCMLFPWLSFSSSGVIFSRQNAHPVQWLLYLLCTQQTTNQAHIHSHHHHHSIQSFNPVYTEPINVITHFFWFEDKHKPIQHCSRYPQLRLVTQPWVINREWDWHARCALPMWRTLIFGKEWVERRDTGGSRLTFLQTHSHWFRSVVQGPDSTASDRLRPRVDNFLFFFVAPSFDERRTSFFRRRHLSPLLCSCSFAHSLTCTGDLFFPWSYIAI